MCETRERRHTPILYYNRYVRIGLLYILRFYTKQKPLLIRCLFIQYLLCDKYSRSCNTTPSSYVHKFNGKKSELLMFKSGFKTYSMPSVRLNGVELQKVTNFNYSGHCVSDNIRIVLFYRRNVKHCQYGYNMLVSRFALKTTLFKTYSQTLIHMQTVEQLHQKSIQCFQYSTH